MLIELSSLLVTLVIYNFHYINECLHKPPTALVGKFRINS